MRIILHSLHQSSYEMTPASHERSSLQGGVGYLLRVRLVDSDGFVVVIGPYVTTCHGGFSLLLCRGRAAARLR
jgi:hypothetical protein